MDIIIITSKINSKSNEPSLATIYSFWANSYYLLMNMEELRKGIKITTIGLLARLLTQSIQETR